MIQQYCLIGELRLKFATTSSFRTSLQAWTNVTANSLHYFSVARLRLLSRTISRIVRWGSEIGNQLKYSWKLLEGLQKMVLKSVVFKFQKRLTWIAIAAAWPALTFWRWADSMLVSELLGICRATLLTLETLVELVGFSATENKKN